MPLRKIIACAAVALALVAAGEPHVREKIVKAVSGVLHQQQTVQQAAPAFADQLGGVAASDMLDVTLYFRFGSTGLLGMERAQLDIRREETVAWSIVDRLLSGPSITHERLSGVFPQGTELISVSGEDTTAFVTLSSAFLGRPDGAPADWEDSADWRKEAALRRRLAAQSIVLSLTEGARYQRVQLYVADGDDEIPRRIPMAWFDEDNGDMATVLAASPRDEGVMLTPGRAMDLILNAWRERDWAAMYPLLCAGEGDVLPALSVFEAEMSELGVMLLDSACSQGSVAFDGQSATIVLDASIRSAEGGDAEIIRESVALERTDDNWTMPFSTLLSLMIRD